MMLDQKDIKRIRTQKAFGIVKGVHKLLGFNQLGASCNDLDLIGLIQSDADVNVDILKAYRLKYKYGNHTVFARPCPKKPRHGFVDSQIVKTKAQLKALWDKVKAEDPNGEILLCKYLKSNYSTVYTDSGYLAVGKGNAGATAGNTSIALTVAPTIIPAHVREAARILPDETVFIEAVNHDSSYSSNQCTITQLRSGPKIVCETDYVPFEITVKKVIAPSDDLLAWEKTVANLPKGTVVYKNGATLASHAAIHCVLNNVAFVTSHKPKIGEVLTPKNAEKVSISQEKFVNGVNVGLKSTVTADNQSVGFILAVLHNWAYLKNNPNASFLLGLASTWFVRLGTALGLGEMRHARTLSAAASKLRPLLNKYRDQIYKTVLKPNGVKYVNSLSMLSKNFYAKNRWRSGFGGKRWGACVNAVGNLWNAVIRTRSNASIKNINSIVNKLNVAINMAHNNGWWFNKMASATVLELAAKHPGITAMIYGYMLYTAIEVSNKPIKAYDFDAIKFIASKPVKKKKIVKNSAKKKVTVKCKKKKLIIAPSVIEANHHSVTGRDDLVKAISDAKAGSVLLLHPIDLPSDLPSFDGHEYDHPAILERLNTVIAADPKEGVRVLKYGRLYFNGKSVVIDGWHFGAPNKPGGAKVVTIGDLRKIIVEKLVPPMIKH